MAYVNTRAEQKKIEEIIGDIKYLEEDKNLVSIFVSEYFYQR